MFIEIITKIDGEEIITYWNESRVIWIGVEELKVRLKTDEGTYVWDKENVSIKLIDERTFAAGLYYETK